MNNITNKKLFFRHFLSIIYYQHADVIDIKDLITDYSRLMRLLYFTCLESCDESIGLFKVFNKFYAYSRGTVEIDVYDWLLNNPDYLTDCIYPIMEDQYNMLVSSINKLRDKRLLCKTLDELIDITHQLPLWNKTYNYVNDKRMKIDTFSLKKECKYYQHLFIK